MAWVPSGSTRTFTRVLTKRAFRDLQLEPVEGHAIIVADVALLLHAKNLVEIDAGDRRQDRSRLLGLNSETRVVGGYRRL